MVNKPGKNKFTITQKLGESLAAEVFSAINRKTQKSVYIKKIRPEFASDETREHILYQQATLLQLGIKQVIIPEIITDSDGALLLIVPWQEGQILVRWLLADKKISIKTLLEIGIALADCLAVRHGATLIHKGVKPDNILIYENPVRIHLIDEIRVSDITFLSHFIRNNQYMRGTLPYLSPEQTGKIRFNVNYSSDLYSMGTVLYECITGRPPFLSDDPLSIIHSHLAETPVPALDLNPNCPKIISDIIAVLLEKASERRYQSAAGLKADLQTCLCSWQKAAEDTLFPEIPSFVLKQKDFSNQISIPSIMVGREQQKSKLLEEYQHVCTGRLCVAMISGLSGIGKTRLIQELERPIAGRRGYYTSGKFNQHNKHLPYATLIEAFSRLIRQLLTEDVKRITYWRKQLLNAVNNNGRLMTDLIPDLVHLIGEQPKVTSLPPVEAKNRFDNLFCRFIASFASMKHPLVLFIDDMQWCDSATFDLLDLVISRGFDFPCLFIIGAYRNNEVGEDHRVIQMEKAIKASSFSLLKLHLDSLEQNVVNEMTAFILNTSVLKTRDITDIIWPVSAGNPLFVNESLRWLNQNRRILLTDKGGWEWDADALTGLKLPDSAKAIFYDRLKQLPRDVIKILSVASILGTRFEIKDLALVMGMPLQKLYTSLKDVIFMRILLQDKYTLSFFHDQLQAAALDFLNEDDRRKWHRQIARIFIIQLKEKEKQKDNTGVPAFRLFSIAEHLNAGHKGVSLTDYADENELFEAAQFNFRAGVAAMDSLAIDASSQYFSQSARLCYDSMWQIEYKFMSKLYKKLARAVLMNGDQKRSGKIVEKALKYAKSDFDRAKYLYEQTVALGSTGDVYDCIRSGHRALKLIGESLPVSENDIQLQINRLVKELHSSNYNIWQEIICAPVIKEKRAVLKLNLYADMLASYYASGQVSMLNMLAMQMVKAALEKGVDDFTSLAMAVIGLYFQIQENYPLAYCYEDTMLKLVKRFPDSFGSVRAMTSGNWFLFHSRNPVSDLLVLCQKTIDSGIKCGELQFAGLSYCTLLWYGFIQGKKLYDLKGQIDGLISFSQKYNLSLPLEIGEALQMGLTDLWEPGSIFFDESYVSARLNHWKEQGHSSSLACYFVFRGVVACYNHEYFQAEQFLDKGQAYLTGITNTIVYRIWYVFRYLTALHTGHFDNSESYLEKVTGWASHGPILKPYLALISAESISLQKDFKETRNAYLNAIDTAHNEKYLFLEAFLNERLWQYLEKEKHFSAKTYLGLAIKLYGDCGAQNKVIKLSSMVPENKPGAGQPFPFKILTEKELERGPNNHALFFDRELDYSYLFDAVKAIAEELDFNKLLKIIMESVMSRLGAKTGFLLIVEKENLIPYVSGIKCNNVLVTFKSEPDFSTSRLSMGIVRYVFQTKKTLLLNDAEKNGDFILDEVVLREKLRSVLCFPLIIKKEVLGVLYLENSLIKSVFSDIQVEFTGLLIAQAAIALQNAALLKDIKLINQTLEERVKNRTKELKKVNVELEDFAYVISHDLKAPLRGINQLAAWISDDYNHQIDEDGQEMLALLKTRSSQMHSMIEGVLQYSRIGRARELLMEVDLNKLVLDVVSIISFPESITFKIKNTLPVIKCEETLIFQVFQNLFDNAVKYMDKEKGNIFVSCIEKDSSWQFCVSDNGPGIDKKYHKKVFKMFQTLKPRDDTESTGIGLALIQKTVNRWGGSIWLESESGKGCSFFFTIPQKRKPDEKS